MPPLFFCSPISSLDERRALIAISEVDQPGTTENRANFIFRFLTRVRTMDITTTSVLDGIDRYIPIGPYGESVLMRDHVASIIVHVDARDAVCFAMSCKPVWRYSGVTTSTARRRLPLCIMCKIKTGWMWHFNPS